MHFASGKSEPLSRCDEKLARLVTWANDHPDVPLGLQGYLDERELTTEKRALAQARVRTVRDALVAGGVPPDRIRVGNGDGNWPLCNERSESCWERNRRVEVWAAVETPR